VGVYEATVRLLKERPRIRGKLEKLLRLMEQQGGFSDEDLKAIGFTTEEIQLLLKYGIVEVDFEVERISGEVA